MFGFYALISQTVDDRPFIGGQTAAKPTGRKRPLDRPAATQTQAHPLPHPPNGPKNSLDI